MSTETGSGLLSIPDLTRTGLQFATNRRWEEALAFDPAARPAFDDWLAAAQDDIAVEALFHDASGLFRGFVGMRRTLSTAAQRKIFWPAMLDAALTCNPTPRDTLRAWFHIAGLPDLLDTPPDSMELGVFNQWYSAVPVPLPLGGLTRPEWDAAPGWLRHGSAGPICRESVWYRSDRVWVADVVSKLDGKLHLIDRQFRPKAGR